MAQLEDLLPSRPRTREEWQAFVRWFATVVDTLERTIRWIEGTPGLEYSPMIKGVLTMAKNVLETAKELLLEASEVPFALVADIRIWLDVAELVREIRDETTEHAFDVDSSFRGRSGSTPWHGRFAEAYLSQIVPQNLHVAFVMESAEKAAGSLANLMGACITKYNVWSAVAWEIAAVLPFVFFSPAEWMTIVRQYAAANALTADANEVVRRETQKMRTLVDMRPRLRNQVRRGDYGVDRDWPNPFNSRLFIRGEVRNGRVFLEGGEPLAINRVP